MSTFDDTAAITVGFGKPYEVAIYLIPYDYTDTQFDER
jgi:hypothetical protein